MLELYESESSTCVRTDIANEIEFHMHFSDAMVLYITKTIHEGGVWEIAFPKFLEQYADIICKLRGYKSDVRVKTVIEAGSLTPSSDHLLLSEQELKEFSRVDRVTP